ncbi:MAG: choice-of-anchor Q domain-containing protein [bacterium]
MSKASSIQCCMRIVPWILVFILAGTAPGRSEPSLNEILEACEYLHPGDIPLGSFQPPSTAVYVATTGNDASEGTSVETPFEHLEKAIEYANGRPEVPLTIYLRGGTYLFKDPKIHPDNPYLRLQRGNLYLTSYPGEEAVIRPYYWPGNPSEYGDERAFEISGSFENITFDRLRFEGWSVIFSPGSPLETPSLKNLTIQNITAGHFTRRNGEPSYGTMFIETGYLDNDVYGEGKQIFDNPGTAHYQIEGLILSNITAENLDLPVNIGDENDANVKGLRITHFDVFNPPGAPGDSASDAFAVVNSYKILIDHCRIMNIRDDGIDTKGYDVAVVNTYIEGTGRNAVKFWKNGEMINTILYNCTQIDDGAVVVKDGPFRMIHSVLLGHPVGYAGTCGYDTASPLTTRFEVVNSVFSQVKSFFVTTDNIQILNNRYGEILEDANLYSGFYEVETVEELNRLPLCGGNAMSPLQFTDPEHGDFSLVSGSSWIDAGASGGIRLPSFDFYGNPRTAGGNVDIGPVEFGFIPPAGMANWMAF